MKPSNSTVLAFYYLWYGNVDTDGRWLHWNHTVLPHWTPEVNAQFPTIGQPVASPPDGVHSRFYPTRGCYSVADPATLHSQMLELRDSGVGTVVLSWWGRPGLSNGDSQGVVTDGRIRTVLDAVQAAGLWAAWHLEPYHGRSVQSVREDVAYLHEQYGHHSALLKWPLNHSHSQDGSSGPVYFVYDSYHLPAAQWASMLGIDNGPLSVRGTELDGVFIGLWLERGHGHDLSFGGFDGCYTYFASDGFSWGASTHNWATIRNWATEHSKLFVASVRRLPQRA